MAQTKKDNKIIYYGQDVRDALMRGAESAYKAVTTTYGPKGRNVLIEKTYGRPVLTRDGVTVAREVYSSDRAANMAMQLILEASSTTNRIAGDGTTATVALAYHLMAEGFKLVAGGHDPMQLREQINEDATTLLAGLAAYSQPAEGKLVQVATVSSGDPLLGQLIAEAVERVGENGGIITEKAHVAGVEREYVDGYYLQQGFIAITEGRREMQDALVVVCQRRLSSGVDALEILQRLDVITESSKQHKRLRVAFIGEVEGEAYTTITANVVKGALDAVIVATPATGDMGKQYLEDIAIYCGCRPYAEGESLSTFNAGNIGRADKVICTQSTTSIFSDAGVPEDIATRVEQLKNRLETEESEFLSEKIRDRLAKLEGKIALFRIGGATETEREEKEFRIEDAIQATRAAYSSGVVPGGGTTLLRLGEGDITQLFLYALRGTFRRLMENAGLPADVKINEVLGSESPMGINLRKGDELVDLVAEGVLDPTLVIEQVITNAASVAGNALTTDCIIVFEDKE